VQKIFKNLLWLLNGGIGQTIQHRNELKERLAVTQADLEKSRQRELTLTQELQRCTNSYPVPFILLNTLPKSGSIFLTESLRQGLNIAFKQVSLGYFPVDVADYRKLIEASPGQVISQSHLDANPTNLQLLRAYCPRMVLHLRDPRQALLSWVHHVKKYVEQGQLTQASVTPIPPTTLLFADNLSAAIDWHIAHHLPNILQWTEQWLLHVETKESPAVFVTYYHDLRENSQNVIARILDFYGIPAWAYTAKDIPKNEFTHFRKGQLDEWRSAFNPAQQKICAEMMEGYPRVWRLYADDQLPAANLQRVFTKPAIQTAVSEYDIPAPRSRY